MKLLQVQSHSDIS